MRYSHSGESLKFMLIGVVSDTHNNLKNIEHIIDLFNDLNVELVIHTGDICNEGSLKKFSKLNCELFGVFGNNDRNESGLNDVINQNSFRFEEPPFLFKYGNRSIAVFHEPDSIENYIDKNKEIDIILHGHTHRFREEIVNGTLIFNPGESAGMQKGNNAIGRIDLNSLKTERIFF